MTLTQQENNVQSYKQITLLITIVTILCIALTPMWKTS